MIIRSTLLAACLISISGCLSNTTSVKNTPNPPTSLNGWKIAYPMGYNAMSPDYRHVLYEKSPDNQWNLIASRNQGFDKMKPGQEQLRINTRTKQISPAYSNHNLSRAGTTFVCKQGGHLSAEHMAQPYNGCNSQLMKGGMTLERLWGETVVVELDPEKVRQLVEETDTITVLDTCRKQHDDIRAYRSKIKIDYHYIDQSGYYDNSTLTRVGVNEPLPYCPMNLEDVSFTFKIHKAYTPYDFDIHPDTFIVKYGSLDTTLISNITVKNRKFDSLYVNGNFSNNDISITIDKIEYESNTARFYYQIENRTQKHLSIETLSFYVNNNILTETLPVPLKLPPMSIKRGLQSAFDSRHPNMQGGNMNQVRMSITGKLNKTFARSLDITLGVSAEYTVGNKTETLYGKKQYNYADIILANN